jgi:hypothetical protein
MEVNYILGIGRSGTTLLTSILNCSDEIHTVPENYFASFFYSSWRNRKHFEEADLIMLGQFNDAFNRLQPYKGYTYKNNEMTTLIKSGFKGSYLDLCKRIYLLWAHQVMVKKTPRIILDKNPSNTLYANQLLGMNPEAKFILITRDYRANILSRLESIHIRPPSIVYNAVRWNYFMSTAYKFQLKHSKKILVVRYEDLVENPQVEVDRVCDFLNIQSFNVDVARENERRAYEVQSDSPDRIKKKYGDLSQPISKDRVNAWKTGLTNHQIGICDFICASQGRKWGYESLFLRKLSFSEKVIYWRARLRVGFELTKDRVAFYLPIGLKVSRFNKFVHKIEKRRNAGEKL